MDQRKACRQYFFMGLALALIGMFLAPPEPIGLLMRAGGGFLVGFNLRRAWF